MDRPSSPVVQRRAWHLLISRKENHMPLDLDKWNPFRFLRSNSAQRSAAGGAGADGTSQQGTPQNGQQTGDTQTANGTPMAAASAPISPLPANWPLPDPI